ncbi:MAG: MarR family transcriptional regulator [Sphingomonadales bacterium]|nr:MarR family transcriptional regulator [Sphingomonadales bacterium]
MGVEKYPEAMDFILHWGEMGTHWGANRSMAQVHALLYLSDQPLDAEAICSALDLARSNVSNSLKELQAYGIVRRTHIAGDRRDHFVAETELWDLFMALAAERKRREIDPTIAKLAELQERMGSNKQLPTHVRERISRMHEFISTLSNWYDEVRRINKNTLVKLMKLGSKITRFIPGSSKD